MNQEESKNLQRKEDTEGKLQQNGFCNDFENEKKCVLKGLKGLDGQCYNYAPCSFRGCCFYLGAEFISGGAVF